MTRAKNQLLMCCKEKWEGGPSSLDTFCLLDATFWIIGSMIPKAVENSSTIEGLGPNHLPLALPRWILRSIYFRPSSTAFLQAPSDTDVTTPAMTS